MSQIAEEEKLGKIRGKMYGKTLSFLDFWNAYFKGEAGDKDLAQMTTQPFWQSMRLSKKRLEDKGLTMETRLLADKKDNDGRDGAVTVHQDGNDLTGCSVCDMNTERIFYKDGKRIYRRKDREICTISILQSDVKEGQAACPNCGYHAPISSFIDGCDSCGSVFSVSDFEAKISGFSLEENTKKKIFLTMRNTVALLARLIGGVTIFGLVMFIILAVLLETGRNGMGAVGSVVGVMFSIDFFKVLINSTIIFGCLYAICKVILRYIEHNPIKGIAIAQKVMPAFSGNDFYQNLEYKLRNIHLTDRASDVSAFATISMEEIVPQYADVVDCDMTGLIIEDAYAENDGYHMDVLGKLRVMKYDGKRIKEQYEDVQMGLFGRKDVVRKNVSALREYKCCNCGSSINILEGSKCAYCGTKFDYLDYGWVITDYAVLPQKHNLYQLIKIAIIAAYVLILGVHLIGLASNKTEDTWFSLTQQVQKEMGFVDGLYDEVIMPEEMWSEAKLIDATDQLLERNYVYEIPMDQEKMLSYKDAFLEKGYFPMSEGPGYFSVWKEYYYDAYDEQMFVKITVQITEQELSMHIEIIEDINES